MSRLALLLLHLVFLLLLASSSSSHPLGTLREDKIRLGSTPPSCRSRCNDCSPCTAVQVPTMPGRAQPTTSPMEDSTYRSYPNYKPLGWKCRCGDRLFNP